MWSECRKPEVKMIPACTAAVSAPADPGGVEIGWYAPNGNGVEIG
jgi:hypothetical protein